jgi:hypothetical protein
MKPPSLIADHHWLALWLLLIGAACLTFLGHDSTFAGMLVGAGFTWLLLVD